MPQPVQRTLILTNGPIAAQAGRNIQELLSARQGPAAVVAVVNLTGPAEYSAAPFMADIPAALTRISATSITSGLLRQGYMLDRSQEIALFLLIDVSPHAGEQVMQLVQQAATIIQAHLGLDTATLLIWLAPEPADEATATCLIASEANHHLFSRGVLALSPLNEAGLRLPDENALAANCAEALWLLVATPLRSALEWFADQDGEAMFGSLGVSQWGWNGGNIRCFLRQRWLIEVISQWLAPAPSQAAPVEIARWIADAGLLPRQIKEHTLTTEEQQPPGYEESVWHAPWPWEVHRLFTRLSVTDAGDQEGQEQRQEWADLRLDEPLQAASQVIKRQLQALLDEKPVSGVAYASQWAAMLSQEFNRLRGELLQEVDQQGGADAALSTARGELEARLQPLLEKWPTAGLFAWLRLAFKPWQWPYLAWRYWQLCSIGQQLTLVYYHQAVRRRQRAMMLATIHASVELEQIARHCLGQAEEIGDMLNYLKREIGDQGPVTSASSVQALSRVEGTEIKQSPNLQSDEVALIATLWSRMVEDPRVEAEMAAAALAGLGQQLVKLDDGAVLASLQASAEKQLARLSHFSAARVIPLLYSTQEAVNQWWQGLWEEATPLWRYDATRLPERTLTQQMTLACLCGSGATNLVEAYHEFLPPDIRAMENDDHAGDDYLDNERQQIFLLRLRGGLTAVAMARSQGEGVTG
jgi:hypothetical protein